MKRGAAAILFGNLQKEGPTLAKLKSPAKALDYAEPCYLPRKWRDELERLTRTHRAGRAAQHMAEAWGVGSRYNPFRASRRTKACTYIEPNPEGIDDALERARRRWGTAVWHTQHARGHDRRFEKLANCGDTFEAVGSCTSCGETTRRPVHCGLVNLCVRCRGREARRLRTRVRERMRNLPAEYCVLTERPGQPWGWKLLTLTVPHGRGVVADAKALALTLWPKFWRQFKAHVRLDCGEELAPLMVKCFELAKTGTDDGHAHYHIAILSPFVHKSYVNLLWGRVLQTAGYACPQAMVWDVFDGTAPGSASIHPYYRGRVESLFVTRRGPAGRRYNGAIPFPVTDLRQADGDVSNELVKYLIKDIHEGQRIPAAEFEALYRAVDGRRRLSHSKALVPLPETPVQCPHCAAERATEVDADGFEWVVAGMAWETINLRPPETPGHSILSALRYEVREEMVAQDQRYWERAKREACMRREFTVNLPGLV